MTDKGGTANLSMTLRMRAGLATMAALLIQYVFLVPFDRRPSWALLGFAAFGALAGVLGLFIFPNNRAIWQRWRQALASPAMLLGLGFILYALARWSVMRVPYAGRVWVIGAAWAGVGLALGSMLGAADRAAQPEPPRAFSAFLTVSIVAGLLVAGMRYIAQEGTPPLPSPGWMPGMPDEAGRVYWPLFFDHIITGAGPGALAQFIGNRPSLASAAAAIEAGRWRVPAELGAIGVVLAAGFFIALLKSAIQAGKMPALLAAALAVMGLALAAFSPAMGRPEAMLLVGTVAGLAIGLNGNERKVRAYDGRLVAAVCALFLIGTMASAMTVSNQVAWRWHLRGDLHMSRGEWTRAIENYGKAQAWQPDNPAHWEAQARAYAQIPGLIGNMSPYLVRAEELDPLRAGAFAELARWMAGQKRWAEADIKMRQAVELDPTNKEYYREMARYKARAVYVPSKRK